MCHFVCCTLTRSASFLCKLSVNDSSPVLVQCESASMQHERTLTRTQVRSFNDDDDVITLFSFANLIAWKLIASLIGVGISQIIRI